MVAGFQGDDERALRGVHSTGGGVFETSDLGVIFTARRMPTTGHDLTVPHQHGTDRGIGGGAPTASFRKGHGFTHEWGVGVLAHSVTPKGGSESRGNNSMCIPASAAIASAKESG